MSPEPNVQNVSGPVSCWDSHGTPWIMGTPRWTAQRRPNCRERSAQFVICRPAGGGRRAAGRAAFEAKRCRREFPDGEPWTDGPRSTRTRVGRLTSMVPLSRVLIIVPNWLLDHPSSDQSGTMIKRALPPTDVD